MAPHSSPTIRLRARALSVTDVYGSMNRRVSGLALVNRKQQKPSRRAVPGSTGPSEKPRDFGGISRDLEHAEIRSDRMLRILEAIARQHAHTLLVACDFAVADRGV